MSVPIGAHMCMIGRIFFFVCTVKGTTLGLWLCTTAITSGRAA